MSKQVATPEQVEAIEEAIADYGAEREDRATLSYSARPDIDRAVTRTLAALGFSRPEATS